MKNLKHTLMFTSVTVFVLFGTLVPLRSTCGCVTQESMILGDVSVIKKNIESYYEQNGSYPTLESKPLYIMTTITAWESDPNEQGLYYSTINEGKGYRLSAYAKRETLFGITVLDKVFDETVN